MKKRSLRIISTLLLAAAPLSFATQSAQVTGSPRLTGSYEIVEKRSTGSQTHVRLQIEFTNPTQRDVRIKHVALFGPHHSGKPDTQPISFLVRSGASRATTQDFVLDRREFEHLRHAAHTRLLLTLSTPGRRPFTDIVVLDRVSSKKGN